MNRQTISPFVVAGGLLTILCLLFGLVLTASAGEGGPNRVASAAGETPAGIAAAVTLTNSFNLYLPGVMNNAITATTSSATLARPAANGQLGVLAGLLFVGMLVGVVLVYSTESEATMAVEQVDGEDGADPTHSDA